MYRIPENGEYRISESYIREIMCVVVCGLISCVWLVFNGTKITLKNYTEEFTALDFY